MAYPTGMKEDSTVDTYLKTKNYVKQENSWVKKHIEHNTLQTEALYYDINSVRQHNCFYNTR